MEIDSKLNVMYFINRNVIFLITKYHYLTPIKKLLSHSSLIRIACCYIFSLSLLTGLFAQNSSLCFKNLSVTDGLSQSWIRYIYQDSYGFMWFGTGGNGLNKYDGYKFTVYKNNARIKNSLSNNSITTIFEDQNRNLWIGTQIGLNLYNRENDCFIVYPGIESQFITGLFETNNGKLFVVSVNNIYEINTSNYSAIPFCKEAEGCLQYIFVDAIVEDLYGNLWLGSTNGLYLLDTLNKTFTIFKHDDDDPTSISDDQLESITKDSKGRLWIGTVNKGLCLMKFRNDQSSDPYFINFTHDHLNERSINNGRIRDVLDDGEGNLWIGTENGGLDILDLKSFEEGKPVFIHHLNDEEDETSLANNSIYSLLKDNQGTIWIGTYGGGLNYYNELLNKFHHFKIPAGNNIINVIYKEDNNLWICTEGGLYFYNNTSDKLEYYQHYPNNRNSIGAGAIYSIFEDSRKNIWVGTWAGGLNLFNREKKNFTRFLNDADNPNSIGGNNIFGLTEDGEGYLWIACMNGGLNRYDYKTNTFKAYRANFQAENSISGDWVRTLFINSYGEFWISTSVGVDLFDRKTERFTHFTHNPDDSTSISYNGAIIFFEDSKQNFWLGTEGGLNSYIREDSSFICYQEEDGLPDNTIKGICEDEHGNLWLSTNKGISKFVNGIIRSDKPIFENFSVSDGLQGDEFNRRSYFKDSDGYMYFGGTNGYNVFHPDSIKKNSYVPPVLITDFLVFNKPVEISEKDSPLKKHISVAEQITLSYKQSMITFEFAALNYLAPEKNQYKYLMEGFDEDWHYVGNKREATYTNLDPGKYIFRVKGSNNDGIWNEEGASIKITILPPWWQTILFRILIILLAISLIIGFYYYRLNQLNKQKHLLQEKVKQRTHEIEEKNAILINQTNELNEINSILEERQQRIEEQAEELKTQAEELSNTNQRLVKLNATKDKFFSIIAHDLKNPFSSILGFCEVLTIRYDNYDDTKRKHLIGVIDRSAQNVFKLLENLLQWSRTQTGNIKYTPEKFSLYDVVQSIYTLLENSLIEKGIKFTHNIPGDLTIHADKNMIYTVIRNLVTNAIKFTELGEITIKAEQDNTHTKISVIDTGIGIRKEVIDKIFEIDKSKSTDGTRGESGTGLGLIICKEFVEQNGGTIGVESEFGKGSTFYFTVLKSSTVKHS